MIQRKVIKLGELAENSICCEMSEKDAREIINFLGGSAHALSPFIEAARHDAMENGLGYLVIRIKHKYSPLTPEVTR